MRIHEPLGAIYGAASSMLAGAAYIAVVSGLEVIPTGSPALILSAFAVHLVFMGNHTRVWRSDPRPVLAVTPARRTVAKAALVGSHLLAVVHIGLLVLVRNSGDDLIYWHLQMILTSLFLATALTIFVSYSFCLYNIFSPGFLRWTDPVGAFRDWYRDRSE